MRILFLAFFLALSACKTNNTNKILFADNPVVAHRGAWKNKNLPENSIAALKEAISLNCTGSEFDVRMTSDNILIVTHDPTYNNLPIEDTTFAVLSKKKLSNGETLPTLKDYLLAGMKNNTSTGLVLEIKPSKYKERNSIITEKVIKEVKRLKADPYIKTYISFSYNILLKIKELDPNANTQYLDGSKAPSQLKKDSISGLDYEKNVFKKHPEWIEEAKKLNLALNVWTVNNEENLDLFIAHNFNYITTNEPELLFKRLKKNPVSNGYQLVWSDEFNYKGAPNNKKWVYDIGFISNEEKQYFTSNAKNVRVEKGNLIIEAHKESVANKDYKSNAFRDKSWLRYIPKIDSAKYTSARIKTMGLASWKYGRIDVRAKLPKGTGLWPAIWMLGENRKEVGWPESGEIDIMEYVGFSPDSIFGTIHTKAYNHLKKTQKGKKTFISNPNDTYHTYSLEWTPEKMDFILDDVVYNSFANEHKTTAEWPFDQKFYLILNVSVGGMLGGQKGIDDTVFPQHMAVDYVRVFQKKEELQNN